MSYLPNNPYFLLCRRAYPLKPWRRNLSVPHYWAKPCISTSDPFMDTYPSGRKRLVESDKTCIDQQWVFSVARWGRRQLESEIGLFYALTYPRMKADSPGNFSSGFWLLMTCAKRWPHFPVLCRLYCSSPQLTPYETHCRRTMPWDAELLRYKQLSSWSARICMAHGFYSSKYNLSPQCHGGQLKWTNHWNDMFITCSCKFDMSSCAFLLITSSLEVQLFKV